MIQEPFYDPTKSYYDNYEHGPFGAFADGEVSIPKSKPAHEFLGKKIHAPFGIPAGPLLNGAFVKAALDKGFSLPIYKTVRSGVRTCHPSPNVLPVDVEGDLTLEKAQRGLVTKKEYSDPLSITNSFGVPSFEPDVWQPDATEAIAYAKEGQMVGVSFEATKQEGGSFEHYVDDWIVTAKLVAETKPHFMEANLSCPNEGTAALLCFDVQRVVRISDAIKSAVGDIPLFLKISYFTEQDVLEQFVKEVGPLVDGIASINTLSAEVRTPSGEQALPGEGRLRSGICGHAIKWAGVEMVERIIALREKYAPNLIMIGVGGVTQPGDYLEYRNAGADAVMSATGAMWNSNLAKMINES